MQVQLWADLQRFTIYSHRKACHMRYSTSPAERDVYRSSPFEFETTAATAWGHCVVSATLSEPVGAWTINRPTAKTAGGTKIEEVSILATGVSENGIRCAGGVSDTGVCLGGKSDTGAYRFGGTSDTGLLLGGKSDTGR